MPPAKGNESQMTVEALRRHRPEVLDDLLERYGRELQGVAYLILRDRAAAEDVVVVLRPRSIAATSSWTRRSSGLWLLRIATNRALGVRRSSSRVVQLHVVPGPARALDR